MPSYIVIDNNGIGYKVFVPNPFFYKENEQYKIYIYEHIREDEHSLYGFNDIEERDLFLKLIDVKGLGPKMALPILATGSISGSVATALTTSNVKVGEFTNDSASINIGTWALGESNTEVSGGIAVGKNGQAQVTGAITIVSGTYVTDVTGVKLA